MDINTAFETPGTLVRDRRTDKLYTTCLHQSTQRVPMLAPWPHRDDAAYLPVTKAQRRFFVVRDERDRAMVPQVHRSSRP